MLSLFELCTSFGTVDLHIEIRPKAEHRRISRLIYRLFLVYRSLFRYYLDVTWMLFRYYPTNARPYKSSSALTGHVRLVIIA